MNLFGKLKYRSEKLKMHVIKKVKIYCYFSTVTFSLAEPYFKVRGVEAATEKKKQVTKWTMRRLADISSNLTWYLGCVISYTGSWQVALVSALEFFLENWEGSWKALLFSDFTSNDQKYTTTLETLRTLPHPKQILNPDWRTHTFSIEFFARTLLLELKFSCF